MIQPMVGAGVTNEFESSMYPELSGVGEALADAQGSQESVRHMELVLQRLLLSEESAYITVERRLKKPRSRCCEAFQDGSASRTRTYNLTVNSRLLYH